MRTINVLSYCGKFSVFFGGCFDHFETASEAMAFAKAQGAAHGFRVVATGDVHNALVEGAAR
jgi:hypothetical protein